MPVAPSGAGTEPMTASAALTRAARPATTTPRAVSSRAATLGLLLPAVVAFALLFVYPMVRIVFLSFTEPEVGWGNYLQLFTDGYTVRIVVRTLWVALVVALIDIVLAFPFAYAMTICRPTTRAVLFTIVLIPFWTNSTAKNYAWLILYQLEGPIDRGLSTIGIDYPLVGTTAGVVVAMAQVLLPFAVLPLYARLGQINRRLVQAAQGLGATPRRSFRTIYLPLAVPGIAASATLTFILSLGFYVTPAILGSPQQTLIAQLIYARIDLILDLGGAGAIGIFLLVTTVVLLWLSQRLPAGTTRGRTSVASSSLTTREDRA